MPNGEESIYNLIPRPQYNPPKLDVHQSKFKDAVRDEAKKNRHEHKTFGYAKEPLPGPKSFLKKHEKEFVLPEPQHLQKDEKRKPNLPDPVRDRPMLGIKTTKNFVQQNAVDNVLAVPKQPVRNVVDTRNGHRFLLDPSGLQPVYVKRKDFGLVPDYIFKRKDEISKAQADYDSFVNEYFKRGALRTMTNEERDSILNGLKKCWDEIHQEYQLLSVVIDTIPKKQRKERLEYEMKSLEKDIELIQRHQLIYIAD